MLFHYLVYYIIPFPKNPYKFEKFTESSHKFPQKSIRSAYVFTNTPFYYAKKYDIMVEI